MCFRKVMNFGVTIPELFLFFVLLFEEMGLVEFFSRIGFWNIISNINVLAETSLRETVKWYFFMH